MSTVIENRCEQLDIDDMNRGQNCPAELVSVYRFQLDYETLENGQSMTVHPIMMRIPVVTRWLSTAMMLSIPTPRTVWGLRQV